MERPRLKLDEVERAVHHIRTNEAKVAIFMLERYVEGASTQWQRIKKDMDDSNEANLKYRISNEKDLTSRGQFWDLMHQTLLDIHFYFVCGDKIQKMLNYIVRKEKGEDLDLFWKEWWPKLEPFNTGRNRFEHFEGQIQGEWRKGYFWIFGNEFKIKNKEFDLSSEGLQKLTGSFEALIKIFEARPLLKSNS
jgi:hypothetical protein